MFLWARADRLRPMHMVWSERNYNEPEYDLIRWRKPQLRGVPRMDWICRFSKVDDDRETRRYFRGGRGNGRGIYTDVT
jgi:hypothetical protein